MTEIINMDASGYVQEDPYRYVSHTDPDYDLLTALQQRDPEKQYTIPGYVIIALAQRLQDLSRALNLPPLTIEKREPWSGD